MELIIHFTALPEKLTLDMVKSDLTTECPGSAWKGSSFLSREDAALWERLSRFWADVARQDAAALREWFAPDTTIELAGTPVGIYE